MVTSLAAITEQAEVQNTAASLCTQTQFLIWQYIRNKPKSQKQPLNLATMQEKEIKEKKPSTKWCQEQHKWKFPSFKSRHMYLHLICSTLNFPMFLHMWGRVGGRGWGSHHGDPTFNFSTFLQTQLSLQQQKQFQTLFIWNKTGFPCILKSTSCACRDLDNQENFDPSSCKVVTVKWE